MTQQILPQEFHLLQDNPVIRTKCPQEMITDEMVAKRVKNGNLIAGDKVLVQCMNSDHTHLLSECEYRVISRTATLRTHELNDRDIRQVEEIAYKVQRWTDWRTVGQQVAPVPTAAPDDQLRAVWNVALRGYDIKRGDVKICFEADKEKANDMAAGKIPLPETA